MHKPSLKSEVEVQVCQETETALATAKEKKGVWVKDWAIQSGRWGYPKVRTQSCRIYRAYTRRPDRHTYIEKTDSKKKPGQQIEG